MCISIVIVEDCPRLRDAQKLVLESQPRLQVLAELDSSGAALDWLQHSAADILVVDLDLADGRAIAVVEACAARHPGCGILTLSRLCDDAVLHRCIDAGAAGYLCGPNAVASLPGAVLDLHAGGAPISPDIARMILERARGDRPAPARPGVAPASVLTARETTVLELVAQGSSDKEVARQLAISFRTVQTHLKNISGKLFAKSRTEAVYQARLQGLLST
ncbi:response regulator transcription factor [Pseudoduganella sp.]|uniref:response regulator transcription factor n=1 Tax=Pseudoduganella sp. TaxID=1880898 RepID=UPI0035B14125